MNCCSTNPPKVSLECGQGFNNTKHIIINANDISVAQAILYSGKMVGSVALDSADVQLLQDRKKATIIPPIAVPMGMAHKPTVEKKPVVTDEQAAATLGLSMEKFKEIQAYTIQLRKKYPQMKPARIQRKVCEHFKIRLV